MKRRLPIGIQDFAGIRENGFIYVDKTACIYELITSSGKAFFLSRPRRFGKSLLCSTLGAVFEGRRELFAAMAGMPALAIDGLDWEWKKHPVIRLDLNPGDYSLGIAPLENGLQDSLQNSADKFGVALRGQDIPNRFKNLIQDAAQKYGKKTVVIIDEYDKPLLASIDKPELFDIFRNALKGFYGVLKTADEYLRFVFLTGVTKFAHVSIFSDLNQLDDITLNPVYADICGITQEELEKNLAPEIEAVLSDTGNDRRVYLDEVRRFYNGYRFSRKPITVYNPFGLFKHFNNGGDFLSYWYETGTPAFLLKLIAAQKINIINLNQLQISYDDFSHFDIENMKAVPVLYQSGHLTITDYDKNLKQYMLDYPNEEVRSSFAKSLLEYSLQAPEERTRALYNCLPAAFFKGEVDATIEALRPFLASIPYDIIKETENYYQTAIHLIFTMLGMYCRSEVRVASGRIDTLVETKDFVYCFEFKLNGTPEEALAQIDTREYLLSWKDSGKICFKIGIVFDPEHRNIGAWKIQKEF